MRIYIFMLVFLSVYGSVHAYAFYRIAHFINISFILKIALGFFLAFMCTSLIIGRALENHLPQNILKLVAMISSIWIGFIFYLFILFLIRDGIMAFSKLTNLWNNQIKNIFDAGQNTLLLLVSITFIICVYAYYEAWDIRIKQVSIYNSKNKSSMNNLNIVQLSDIHLGALIGKEKLDKILLLVKEINPDLIIFTGDIIDADLNHVDEMTIYFSDLKPRYGKYAVTGNHEFYAGIVHAEIFYEQAGIKLLHDEVKTIPGIINIIGVDDQTGKSFGELNKKNISELIKGTDKNIFTILLKHQPRDFKEAQELGVDLMLSGHTHNGQLFPFNLLVYLFFNPQQGLHKIKNSFLYISRGTGTWGPPMRFLSPPEVTWIKVNSN